MKGCTKQEQIQELQRRMAIRITSAYRTISTDAALMMTGTPPITERISKDREGESIPRSVRRNETLKIWQDRWIRFGHITWTKQLRPTTWQGVGIYVHRIGVRCWLLYVDVVLKETQCNCRRWERATDGARLQGDDVIGNINTKYVKGVLLQKQRESSTLVDCQPSCFSAVPRRVARERRGV